MSPSLVRSHVQVDSDFFVNTCLRASSGPGHSGGQLHRRRAAVRSSGGEQEEKRVRSFAVGSSQPEPVCQHVAGRQNGQQELPRESVPPLLSIHRHFA